MANELNGSGIELLAYCEAFAKASGCARMRGGCYALGDEEFGRVE